ncbi:MAG: O-antigen ligase family protein [candidate division WOR-3 bacterium]
MLKSCSPDSSPTIAENKKWFLLILLLQAIPFLSFLFLPGKAALAFILGIGGIIFIAFHKEPTFASLLLSIFVVIVLPRATGRTFFFKVEEIFPLLTIFFLFLASWEGKTSQIPIGGIGKSLLGFLIVVAFAAFIGCTKGNPKILVFDEMMMLLLWGIYFIILKMDIQKKEMKNILLLIILASLIVAFYYLYQFWASKGVGRVCTDQQHIFNFSIPLLFATFLYERRIMRKVLAVSLTIPMILAVYVTLTRALWLLIPLTLFSQYLYFIKRDIPKRRFHSYLFPILVVIIIGLLGLMIFTIFLGVRGVLGARFASLKILEYDVSLLARVELAHYVLERFRKSPLLGVGLADFVRYRYFSSPGRPNIYLLDNTYLQLLWKTGIFGLIPFLGMLIFFLRRAWFILQKGRSDFDKTLGSSFFFSIFALIITGLESAILVGYRFNLVWGILAGITELRAREIEKQITKNLKYGL